MIKKLPLIIVIIISSLSADPLYDKGSIELGGTFGFLTYNEFGLNKYYVSINPTLRYYFT